MRILLVKLTSMGDLVQALPAITDLHRHLPHAHIDWVVDKAFAEIPTWHPAIHTVYTTNHRTWYKHPFKRSTWRAIASDLRAIRSNRYDLVIDLQNNYKSALITKLAHGTSCGPAKGDTAEPLVHLLYAKRISVSIKQLAINRWRTLLSGLFGYSYEASAMDFHLAKRPWQVSQHQPPGKYLVFVTNASWDNKRLAQSTWIKLAITAKAAGYEVLLPWGNDKEKQFAKQLQAHTTNTHVLPRLGLTELASLLYYSGGAICNDTGLAHLAAALHIPTVTCYGPTDPQFIGATGHHSLHLQAEGFSCRPCYNRTCKRNPAQPQQALCLINLQAQLLWQQFTAIQKQRAMRG